MVESLARLQRADLTDSETLYCRRVTVVWCVFFVGNASIAALLALFGQAAAGAEWLDVRRPRWILGTPDEARATVARFAAVGVERLVLQDFLPWDLEMIDLLGEVLVRS